MIPAFASPQKEEPTIEPSLQIIPITDAQKQAQIKIPTSVISESHPVGSSFSSSQVTPTTTQTTNLFSFTSTPNQVQPLLFGGKQPTQSLAGGQASLMPIKPKTTVQPPPFLEQISITPVTQPTKTVVDDKYSSIFSSLHSQPSSSVASTQLKPIVISTPPNKSALENKAAFPMSTPKGKLTLISKPEVSISARTEVDTQAKPEATNLQQAETTRVLKPEATVVSETSKIDTESMLKMMIKDECIALEGEVKAVIQKGKRININLGSDTDKIEMLNIIQNLEEFVEEILEISVGEHSEVSGIFSKCEYFL